MIVSNTLPPNVSLFSLLPSEGTASNRAGVVTYTVGSLPNGIASTLAIVVIPNAAGLLTNIAVEQASGLNTRESMLANLAGFATFLIFMGAAANIAKAGAFGCLSPGILFFSLHF